LGLNQAAERAGIPFVCGGLDPMTTMTFTDAPADQTANATFQSDPGRAKPTSAGQSLLWEYFLQEMAVRGVLLRRGGLNFLTYSHTPEQVDQVIAIAADVFQNLSNLWDISALRETIQQRKHSAVALVR
jgi:glutamate-1-semialdehyde aminotransferase